MRRLIAALTALMLVAGMLPYLVRADDVCFRDGSCVPAGTTATVTPYAAATRPAQTTGTPSPTGSPARATATPTATGTPCVVVLRDGSSVPCGSTATP